MSELLVSVRSAEEAEAALEGGAGLIDVKEPSRGSLGRADEATVRAVVEKVAGCRPVSVALGEVTDWDWPRPIRNSTYIKMGLSGCAKLPDWRQRLAFAADHWCREVPRCRPVAVAYADWKLVQAPAPEEICALACANRWGAFLVDSATKDGRTLLEWMSMDEIGGLCQRCRAAGVPVALAGSLGAEQIRQLIHLQPDWFAVRGSVCSGGSRTGQVDVNRVRQLATLLRPGVPVATRAD
jgi:hypothetical protein